MCLTHAPVPALLTMPRAATVGIELELPLVPHSVQEMFEVEELDDRLHNSVKLRLARANGDQRLSQAPHSNEVAVQDKRPARGLTTRALATCMVSVTVYVGLVAWIHPVVVPNQSGLPLRYRPNVMSFR